MPRLDDRMQHRGQARRPVVEQRHAVADHHRVEVVLVRAREEAEARQSHDDQCYAGPIAMACPICHAPPEPNLERPHAPFCSARCKRIDLGRWLGEGYCIPDDAPPIPLPTRSDEEFS